MACSNGTPSIETEEVNIININDGAVYLYFHNDPLFSSIDNYQVVMEDHVFSLSNTYNLIILNLEKHRDKVTTQLIDRLHGVLNSDYHVMIIFSGFSSYEIFKDTLFDYEGNTYDNHDQWIRFYSNFSIGGSYNLNINDESWKLYSASRSLFSKGIIEHVGKL